jgi:hypothetical protein
LVEFAAGLFLGGVARLFWRPRRDVDAGPHPDRRSLMPTDEISPSHIRNTIQRHVELWNTGDRAAWLQHWRTTCPGGYALEDPVGTPVKRGFDLLAEVWDRAFADAVLTATIELLIVCGREAALVTVYRGDMAGTAMEIRGIETYRFDVDRSVHQRTFFELPESAYAEWTARTGDDAG